jgi:hypothetical protein
MPAARHSSFTPHPQADARRPPDGCLTKIDLIERVVITLGPDSSIDTAERSIPWTDACQRDDPSTDDAHRTQRRSLGIGERLLPAAVRAHSCTRSVAHHTAAQSEAGARARASSKAAASSRSASARGAKGSISGVKSAIGRSGVRGGMPQFGGIVSTESQIRRNLVGAGNAEERAHLAPGQ